MGGRSGPCRAECPTEFPIPLQRGGSDPIPRRIVSLCVLEVFSYLNSNAINCYTLWVGLCNNWNYPVLFNLLFTLKLV